MRNKRILQGIFWILIYLLVTLAPILLILAGPRPEGREFWREFSVGLGFGGLAMMALQFVLTARFKVIKAPYGSDIVYFFHRQISLVAFVLILAHPILLFIFDPRTLELLNFITAPWRARAAVTATLALIVLVVISVWRKRLKIDYTRWRIAHGLLATAAMTLALVHIMLVGHYTGSPLARGLWIAYGAFFVGLLLWVRVIKPFLLLRTPFKVVEVQPQPGSAYSLVLQPAGHSGFRFQPGQFAWITAWNSPFADTEHPFSLSSSAEQPGKIEFTIKELGDFTRTIKTMQPGQTVYVDGPYGSFSPDRHPHAGGFVFIAGGIGITPIMSMMRTLADRGDRRPLTLIYANKVDDAVPFRDEIEKLKSRLNLRVVEVLETPPANWEGEQGFVTRKVLEKYLPPERARDAYEIFICGPKPMMDAVERSLVELGIFIGDFHSERFDLV
ncbi:MAG: ferric reductase-like transmembrane domain-containing protein [Anaerolineae bacterium]|nr:ferric reductase-like transmembrane domain-containing protein [Anaerolineae bacterium]